MRPEQLISRGRAVGEYSASAAGCPRQTGGVKLVIPAPSFLESYCDALRRGWSPNTVRPEVASEELESIAADADGFLRWKSDLDGHGPPMLQADGSLKPRLPGFSRWMWDGEFSGSISFRWQPGTTELPPFVLGHIGYTVVPWKRRQGYATRALAQLLDELDRLDGVDLPFVEVTTDESNIASQRVIEVNGGRLVERFEMLEEHGGGIGLRYRIPAGCVADRR